MPIFIEGKTNAFVRSLKFYLSQGHRVMQFLSHLVIIIVLEVNLKYQPMVVLMSYYDCRVTQRQ